MAEVSVALVKELIDMVRPEGLIGADFGARCIKVLLADRGGMWDFDLFGRGTHFEDIDTENFGLIGRAKSSERCVTLKVGTTVALG